MQKHLRDFVRAMADHGITATLIRQNRHPIFLLEGHGKATTYAVPSSPGDHRWLSNAERDVRSIMGIREAAR